MQKSLEKTNLNRLPSYNSGCGVRAEYCPLPNCPSLRFGQLLIFAEGKHKNKKGFTMKEYKLVYRGPQFKNIDINPVTYSDGYFQTELDLESNLFFELRKNNGIKPYKINGLKPEELIDIKAFFNKNKDTFYFLLKKSELIGTILYLNNYIQSLCINRMFQNK
ncbi:MAG: hypothetical protein JXR70_11355 [Spirochaetales bacterium]|nr:hypothetical protein [Spirochaetales bacterium]